MRPSAVILVLALASGTPEKVATQPVAFEVASVKLNTARDGDRDGDVTASQLRMRFVTLRDLIHFAYARDNGNLRSDAEVVGGPGWIASSHFDIVATVSGMPAGLDAANTAAALESFDRASVESDPAAPCRILIGEGTLRHLNGHFDVAPLGGVSLKGKAEPVMVYRLLDRRPQATAT